MNELFYVITMKAKSGKQMYLSMATGKPTWGIGQGEACMWDDEQTTKA